MIIAQFFTWQESPLDTLLGFARSFLWLGEPLPAGLAHELSQRFASMEVAQPSTSNEVHPGRAEK